MKYTTIPLLIALFSMLWIACSKDDDASTSLQNDCIFEQNDDRNDGLIDATERSIMDQCLENALTSKSEIEQNLIGEWKLIGHGEGWVASISQPCGYITINETELVFDYQDGFVDTVTTHEWEIQEINGSTGTYFTLNILTNPVHGLFLTQFCEDYMYGDATPVDGNMYLYQKVR